MSEAIYQKVQLGRESTRGTAVAATTVLPVDAGFLGFELDRATESPDEDFGRSSREQAGRTSHGVRFATATLPFVMRFQDFFHALEMHWAGSVSPTGAGPYTYVYPADETSDSLKTYTVEYGDINSTQDEWRGVGVVATDMEIGFDALSSPSNQMWRCSLGLVAWDRDANAMTAGQSPPATLETMEGHLTTVAEGTVATAFASLSVAAATLKQFSLRSSINAAGRAYGGTSDLALAWGRSGKATGEVDMLLAISATTKSDVLDIFDVAGSVASERRFRIAIDGSGNNAATLDYRLSYRVVDKGEHEGEHLYAVNGQLVYDSTLASRSTFTLINDIASVP